MEAVKLQCDACKRGDHPNCEWYYNLRTMTKEELRRTAIPCWCDCGNTERPDHVTV